MADWNIIHLVYNQQYNPRLNSVGKLVFDFITTILPCSNSTIFNPARFLMTFCHAWIPSQLTSKSYDKKLNS